MRIGFLAAILWLGGQLWYGVQLPHWAQSVPDAPHLQDLAPNYTDDIDPCNLHRSASGSRAHELALVGNPNVQR